MCAATIAWSYDLLSEPEQRLFARLGVFVGSFELKAAERICDAKLDDLQSLVDKSLHREGDSGRFFLLETTREYTLEQLDASEDQDDVRGRHARWYSRLASPPASRAGAGGSLTRLRQDAGNVSLALAWALEHDVAAGLPLADSVFYTWLGASHNRELRRWYEPRSRIRACSHPASEPTCSPASASPSFTPTHPPRRGLH